MSGPSHNIAMAASKVARTSPTLPPSAMNASAKVSAPATLLVAILPRAFDDDADIVEGGGDRGVRLVHGDADAPHLGIMLQHRLGDRTGGGFHEPIAARAERLARRLRHQVVGDSVL